MKSLRSLSQPSEFQRTGNAVNDMLFKRKKIKNHISLSSIFNDNFKIRKPIRLYLNKTISLLKRKNSFKKLFKSFNNSRILYQAYQMEFHNKNLEMSVFICDQ